MRTALRQAIDADIDAYEKSADAVCAVHVVDLRTGGAVTERRIDTPMVPGSNQKLLTSAFALQELGPDFAFTTRVYRVGRDIVVAGDGNCLIGAPDRAAEAGESIYAELDRWAAAVKAEVGDAPAGDLIMCSAFDLTGSRPPAWAKHVYGQCWAPPTGGLNFHDNLVTVAFDVADGKAAARVQPQSRLIRVVNRVTVGEKTAVSLRCSEDDAVLELAGTIAGPVTRPMEFPVNHPELFTGRVLADRLIAAGVAFRGKIRTAKSRDLDPAGGKLLHETRAPIAETLRRTNTRSLQMAALTHYLRAGDGTWANGPKLLRASLETHYGLAPDSFAADEGSGISSVDRVSPAALVALLGAFPDRPGGRLVVESIPRSGIAGTMTSQLADPPYRGRVRGKIGWSHRAYCLSGYVLDPAGEPVMVYSIMANDMPPGAEEQAKPLQSAILRRLVDYVDGR
jgi:D-alanyl-D-alanine carboxypeptidase/D-alanyl-D-alanine-endopeptidase (penicillin-binding protein 4)